MIGIHSRSFSTEPISSGDGQISFDVSIIFMSLFIKFAAVSIMRSFSLSASSCFGRW